LTVHLAARWLPFEKETAAEALRLSRALISPRTSGRSVARAAVPFYRALVAARIWRAGAPAADGAAADAAGRATPPAEVRAGGRAHLTATVERMYRERAECERSLARGRLGPVRAEALEMQAEELTRDIAALEKLLRSQEPWAAEAA
jgi:hypothetical protein